LARIGSKNRPYSNNRRKSAPIKPFPVMLAAIDIGSNAIRLQVSEFYGLEQYSPIFSERFPIRLGKSVFFNGYLDKKTIKEALSVMNVINSKMRSFNVSCYRAVATSALREAKNGKEFIDKVRRKIGIKIETISSIEEARLSYLSVSEKIDLKKSRSLLIDLGGGSVEISLVDKTGIKQTESRGIGAVRLLEEFDIVKKNPKKLVKLLKEYISIFKIKKAFRCRGIIATGGNIERLCHLIGSRPNVKGVRAIDVRKLKNFIEQLSKYSEKEIMKKFSLSSDKADVMLPAAMVYLNVANQVKAKWITVPFVGVKEGVIIDLMQEISKRGKWIKEHEKLVYASALNLGRKFNFEEKHGIHVAKLSLSLFDQLKGLHKFGPYERKLLMAASLLHDIGTCISYKNHHKHSMYMISQFELPSFSPLDMVLAANIARYHRKSEPTLRHNQILKLSTANRRVVARLASLLRVADALDRDHLQRIKNIKVTMNKRKVDISYLAKQMISLDMWAFEKKASMFVKSFGVKPRLIPQRSAK
jgi:exopolyphosphatase / guanosine-5'-triphosphate,3'-diphosphate pyrophosphatase